MSLDKWLKQEKKEKKPAKGKKELQNEISSDIKSKEFNEKLSTKLVRFVLVCLNAKCKYQKIIVKKSILDDKICPRCKGKMKIKESKNL